MAKVGSKTVDLQRKKKKMPSGKPFKRNDPETGFKDDRINRKGYLKPRSQRELEALIDEIADEQVPTDDKQVVMTKLRLAINRLLLSKQPAGPIYIIDRRFGKIKDEVVISSDSVEQLLQYLPDDLLERIAQGEKVGDVLVEWIANLRESKTNAKSKS